jgi:hypothetical protein
MANVYDKTLGAFSPSTVKICEFIGESDYGSSSRLPKPIELPQPHWTRTLDGCMGYSVSALANPVLWVAPHFASLFRGIHRYSGERLPPLSNLGALELDDGRTQLPGKRCRLLLR